MGIDWVRFRAELRRRRAKVGRSQDWLAAKTGVTWSTIARLETGKRRPSIALAEKLAGALACQTSDLLVEEGRRMKTLQAREPSLRGVPTFFRANILSAEAEAEIGHDLNTGETIYADYEAAGWHFGINIDRYLTEEATADLERVAKAKTIEKFGEKLITFFEAEFPACIALVPVAKREEFLVGIYRAIDQDRFPVEYPVSDFLEGLDEEARETAQERAREELEERVREQLEDAQIEIREEVDEWIKEELDEAISRIRNEADPDATDDDIQKEFEEAEQEIRERAASRFTEALAEAEERIREEESE
jgi:DNA-binding XRE family transcriptional regulator